MKVSACIITYNHENYIRECLEGAINQIIDYDYEIVISDDKSSDNTLQICLEYASKYPNLIRILPSESNLGMIGNWIKSISNCKGEYIALCEGDDYWTDPYKLQKQVDFLEANPDYGVVFTNAKIFDQNKVKIISITNHSFSSFDDYLLGGGAISCTSMFRKDLLKGIDSTLEYLKEYPMVDLNLWLWISSKSKIKVLKDITSVYRVSDNTASNHNDFEKRLKFIEASCKVRLFFAQNYNRHELIPHITSKHWLHVRDLSIKYQDKCLFKQSMKELNKFGISFYIDKIIFHTIRIKKLKKINLKLNEVFK